MKKNLFPIFVLACSGATAEDIKYYITDKVLAPIHVEQNEKSKLLNNGLDSGTPVILLERNDKTGYAHIRTTNNEEGWIRTQYLSTEAPTSIQLEQANALIAKLQGEKKQLDEQLAALKQMSTSQIDTHQRNADLVKQNSLLITEKELLATDNERLKERKNQIWFLYGGLLVAFGSILSALIPKLVKKRRSDGWYS